MLTEKKFSPGKKKVNMGWHCPIFSSKYFMVSIFKKLLLIHWKRSKQLLKRSSVEDDLCFFLTGW